MCVYVYVQKNVYLFVPDLTVWVSDSQRPFVKVQKEIPDVVYMKEGENLVFPCRVTNPDTKVSLIKVSFSSPVHIITLQVTFYKPIANNTEPPRGSRSQSNPLNHLSSASASPPSIFLSSLIQNNFFVTVFHGLTAQGFTCFAFFWHSIHSFFSIQILCDV